MPALVLARDPPEVRGWVRHGPASAEDRPGAEDRPRPETLKCANVLRKLQVSGRLTDAEVAAIAAQVGAAGIIVEPQTERIEEVLERSLRFGLSAYDTACLGVAMRLRLPIACHDGVLARAADAAGVGVFRP